MLILHVSSKCLVNPLHPAPSDVVAAHVAMKEMDLAAKLFAVTRAVRIWSARSLTPAPVKRVTLDTTVISLCVDQTARTEGNVCVPTFVNVHRGTTEPSVKRPTAIPLANMVGAVHLEITALVLTATWDQDVKLWCVTDIVNTVASVRRLMSVSVSRAGTDPHVTQLTVSLCA